MHDLSRRVFLQRLGVAGMGLGGLLAGCGGVEGTESQGKKQADRAKGISHPKTEIGRT